MTSVLGMEVPGYWSLSRLKHVTALLSRGSAPIYADEGRVRVIGQASNQVSGLDWERTRFHRFTGDIGNLKSRLFPDDVLINSTGTGTLGRIGYFSGPPDDISCMADGHVTVVRFMQQIISPRFGYYWLLSRTFQDYIYAALIAGSTNQIELNADRLGGAPLPIPSLEEQRRIVDFLDTEAARIERLKAARERQIAAINELAHAYVSDYLVPGSVSRPAGKLPWTWLPLLPADRPLVRLGYICRLQNGLTIDSARDISGDVVTRPYLRVANVQAGHLSLDSVTEIRVPRVMAERSTLRHGDVLMTEGGDLDKLGRGTVWRDELPNCLHQNHVFALRPDRNRLDGDYLALLTQSLHGRCYFESTGTKTTNLASTNSSKILDFPIPLPSVEVQRDLVRSVRDKLRTTSSAMELLDRQLSLLAERRQALITAAVTGQLDVTTARGVDVS